MPSILLPLQGSLLNSEHVIWLNEIKISISFFRKNVNVIETQKIANFDIYRNGYFHNNEHWQ